MSDERGKLFSKLAKISAIIGKMETDGKNEQNGKVKWHFISSEQCLASARKHLSEHNICLIPEVIEYKTEEAGKYSSGTKVFMTTVKMSFTWVDGDTGFAYGPIIWHGQDTDSGKSMAQAITEAHKRFLFKTFMISSQGEDPDRKSKELAQSIMHEHATTKNKFIELYKKSTIKDKDAIIETMKLQHGPEIGTWPKSALNDLECKLLGTKTKVKSLDDIESSGYNIEDMEGE